MKGKCAKGNKRQEKKLTKHPTSSSVDKTFSAATKKVIGGSNGNGVKVLSKKNTSLPKTITKKSAEAVVKRQHISFLEMETARIFIDLLTPLISHRNAYCQVLTTDDSIKSNRDNVTTGMIYKKTHPVFKSKVYGRVVKQFSKFLPKRIQLIPTPKTVKPSQLISDESKIKQMIEFKQLSCLPFIFLNKLRSNFYFSRLTKAFEDELLGIFHNYNSLYAVYLDNQRQRDLENLNSTLERSKTSGSYTITQGNNIKTVKSEAESTVPKSSIRKRFDIGLTPLPAKKQKAKRYDYEFISATRAANLIRRIEYSNYIKYSQPKTKEDFINLLNSRAVVLQRWWRRMLTNNTFYYKVLTIQRLFRGHLCRSAFLSSRRLICFFIPFYSKLIFVYHKARMNHLFNRLLCYSAYLYQYTVINEMQLVIIRGFKSYKRRNRQEYTELSLNRCLFNNEHMKRYFSNVRYYKLLLTRVRYLQQKTKQFLQKCKAKSITGSFGGKSKGRVITLSIKKTPSHICSKLIEAIQINAHRACFGSLLQFDQEKKEMTKRGIKKHQREIMVKLIMQRHLFNCFKWMKKQIHWSRLKEYFSMKLIQVLLRNFVYKPGLIIISEYITQDMSCKVQIREMNKDLLNIKLKGLIAKAPIFKLKSAFFSYFKVTVGENKANYNDNSSGEPKQEQQIEAIPQLNQLNSTQDGERRHRLLRKLLFSLMNTEKNTVQFSFTKFLINSQRKTILSLKEASYNFSFNAGQQESNPAITLLLSTSPRCNHNNKVKCFIIINHIHCVILRRFYALFKAKTKGFTPAQPMKSKSKIVELCLRNILKTSSTCQRATLARYFMKYHSIVYLTQLNDLYILSTNSPSSDKKVSFNESNHELPSNILRISLLSRKNKAESIMRGALETMGAHFFKMLLACYCKWKTQITRIKLDTSVKMIQRNWKRRLSPKKKLCFLLLRLFNKKH